MKILFIQETDWIKRGPHQQHHLADRLSLRGHEIKVIDYEFKQHSGKKEFYSRRRIFENIQKVDNRAKVTVIRPGIIKIPIIDYLSLLFTHKKEIDRQIKEFSPDVIVGYGILNAYLASKIARRCGIPFIYYWIDILHRLIPNKAFQPIGKLIEKKTIKEATMILAINISLGDYILKLGARRESIKIIGAGIDISKFDQSINGESVRQKYGIRKDDKVIFFMGWLYKFSGLKEVALKMVELDDAKSKLLIVGEGDDYAELKNIQATYKIWDRLIIAGKRPYEEMAGFVAASDVCLLPSYPWEPIVKHIVPIKLYEYMAMGKPVVTTRLPGVVAEFGYDNSIFYVDKPEDLIEKAIELTSKLDFTELGAKARKFAEKNSWENIVDEFEKVLQDVIKEKAN